MSHDRLILPKRPRHHKRRFVIAVAICGFLVVGIWGWQIKMTYGRYTAVRAVEADSQAITPIGESLDLDAEAQNITNSVNELKSLMEAMARQAATKEQLRQEVVNGLKTEMNNEASLDDTTTDTEAVPASLPLTGIGDDGAVN